MADGQTVWAACEWGMRLRNCFVREESDRLVVGSGLRPDWWRTHAATLGPTLTPFGAVTVSIESGAGGARLSVHGEWRGERPRLECRVPGFLRQERVAVAAREEFTLTESP